MSLKKLAVIAFSAGLGVVIGVAALFWAHSVYTSRKAQVWNSEIITAQFKEFTFATDDATDKPSTLVFEYTFANNGTKDYQLNKDDFEIFSIDAAGDMMSTGWDGIFAPIFVPPGSKVHVSIWSNYKYGDAFDYAKIDQGGSQSDYAALVREKRPKLAGFAVLDKTNRYRIDLPKGW